jgi:hypothetical protein
MQVERQPLRGNWPARRRYSRPVSESRNARIAPRSPLRPSPSRSRCWRSWPASPCRHRRRRNRSCRARAVAIVVDHQRALAAVAVGVGEDVFVHRAVAGEKVVEQEVAALGKEPAALEQRRNLALVALDEPVVGRLVVARPRYSMPYFSVKPSIWPWPNMGSRAAWTSAPPRQSTCRPCRTGQLPCVHRD